MKMSQPVFPKMVRTMWKLERGQHEWERLAGHPEGNSDSQGCSQVQEDSGMGLTRAGPPYAAHCIALLTGRVAASGWACHLPGEGFPTVTGHPDPADTRVSTSTSGD